MMAGSSVELTSTERTIDGRKGWMEGREAVQCWLGFG